MTENNQKLSTRKIAFIGIFGALAWVLMFIKLPFAYIGFLEIEFSDIPAIVGAITMGPLVGVFIELIKNVLHLTATSTAGVGELANFITSCGYILPLAFMTKKVKSLGRVIAGCGLGTVGLMVTGALVNIFITIPMYVKLYFDGNNELLFGLVNSTKLGFIPEMQDYTGVVLLGITPFNMFKGILISIVGCLCYQALKYPIQQIINMNE